MANSMRGEADLEIGGKTYTVCIHMGALAAISEAAGVSKFQELQEAAFLIPNMPKIVKAILAANNAEVSEADLMAMDWRQYLDRVIPALFRTAREGDDAASPTKSQKAKK